MLNTKLLNVIYSKTWKSHLVPSGNKGAIHVRKEWIKIVQQEQTIKKSWNNLLLVKKRGEHIT